MTPLPLIRLATPRDAAGIAAMSRDYVEQGLVWSWTEVRVLAAIGNRATNVAVLGDEAIVGFGIMHYGDDSAHLSLLAVYPDWRQRGIGALLMTWLEKPARVAGIECVRLEARADNPRGIAFYMRQGYRETGRVPGYYQGAIEAVRLEKRLDIAVHVPRR